MWRRGFKILTKAHLPPIALSWPPPIIPRDGKPIVLPAGLPHAIGQSPRRKPPSTAPCTAQGNYCHSQAVSSSGPSA
jgi:hypothetical protein